ncbi:bifunctional diguanylate cyclase/phosphodiesterase [Actinomycetospora sp. OC33-EN08]|uniref:Bifunctional diguanylate cyclase/phosphodiesterase n=1 Tax=Actinomycetospora aurantiaca TaxID=3129233 RepID=A0ABU8MU00_9PSEU
MWEPTGTPGVTDLDGLVAAVATRLMGATSAGLVVAVQDVLSRLVAFFEVDLSFLRFHDLARRTTNLVAEWPPRPVVPDPDPLGVIPFATADPVFAATEHLTAIGVRRPRDAADYQERVRQGSGIAETSVAMVPLRAGGVTTGGLGFVKYGDRSWEDAELRALTTIGLLFAQMQGRIAAEDRLRHLADHDELTGLPHRRTLLDHLARDRTGALLVLDVDRLQALNDFLGHEAGDRFLVTTGERLRAVVGPDDVVARLGGDRFAVALDGPVDESHAREVARSLRHAVAEPVLLAGQSLTRTASVGIGLAAADPETDRLRGAEEAVLAAKSRGGNEVAAFSAAMLARERMRVAVEMTLPAALRGGALGLAYQPIVDLATRATVGVEALARWEHPTLGAVPPELFVGVAEATNLAAELGDWVLDRACRQLAAWRAAAPGLVVSVNLSPLDLVADDLADRVRAALVRHGLSGRDLVLEVTEHAVVSDDAAALRTLRRLRAEGVAIAIDDFGTGYSSLAQLKAFPVTVLKIDRRFVRDLGTDADDLAIVRSIAGLAESFGLDLVAEGVESERAAAILADLGCRHAQGHLFAPARPA